MRTAGDPPSPEPSQRSAAVTASWICLVLAVASTLGFGLIMLVQNVLGLKFSSPDPAGGVLLFLPLAGAGIAILSGAVSFFLLRRDDLHGRLLGIVGRSLLGIIWALILGVPLYFVWAMVAFGF